MTGPESVDLWDWEETHARLPAVLLEAIADGFQRSVGHATVRLWSQDGGLLGIAQQSAIVRTSHHRVPVT